MAKRYAFIVANSDNDMVFQLNKLDKSDAIFSRHRFVCFYNCFFVSSFF